MSTSTRTLHHQTSCRSVPLPYLFNRPCQRSPHFFTIHFSFFTNHKAAVLHPPWGGDGGLAALPRGLRHLRMALWDDWGISPAAACDRGFAPGPQNFFEKKFSKSFYRFCCASFSAPGLTGARWQERSARNVVSGRGVDSPPYWTYGKKPQRSPGATGPASAADTRATGSPN